MMGRQLKRVPIDFDWPLHQVWDGYLNPFHDRYNELCSHCKGSGYSTHAKYLMDKWYGRAYFVPSETGSTPFNPDSELIRKRVMHYGKEYDRAEAVRLCGLFNKCWSHHLSQDDVNALVEAGRLCEFTHIYSGEEGWKEKDTPYRPTAKEVNEWSIFGAGHDGINSMVCVSAKCKRSGWTDTCSVCKGEGIVWTIKSGEYLVDAWEDIEPPKGEGYQLWETVTEGSPITPVFATPEELARWLVGHDNSITCGTTFEQWMQFIQGPGWSVTAVGIPGKGLVPGVQAASLVEEMKDG